MFQYCMFDYPHPILITVLQRYALVDILSCWFQSHNTYLKSVIACNYSYL
jgi:hypothetical protein